MPKPPPDGLEEVRAIADPAARARAIRDFIDRAQAQVVEANRLRRLAIAEYLTAHPEQHGKPGAVAKACNVSVSTVKNVRDAKT